MSKPNPSKYIWIKIISVCLGRQSLMSLFNFDLRMRLKRKTEQMLVMCGLKVLWVMRICSGSYIWEYRNGIESLLNLHYKGGVYSLLGLSSIQLSLFIFSFLLRSAADKYCRCTFWSIYFIPNELFYLEHKLTQIYCFI